KFVSQPVNLEELEEDLTDYRSILSETTQNTSKSYPAKEQTSKSNEKANLPKPVKGKQKTHKVQKGESIYSISKKYGLDYNSVIQLNGFKKSTIIRPGQVIRLK
ncbi:MAG: LysM peptidoglycan-binding domain-containing protein, partial [Crocinitomicaceae bacterium]